MSVRSPSVRPSGYFGSFMPVDRHRRQDFWTHMFKQNLTKRKIGPKKTEFKQERNDRPKSVFEKCLKNFPQAMYAQKYRIVFYWIHMFGVKPRKISPFQPENTSNTSDWRVRTNLNGTAQKPWGPPLPRGKRTRGWDLVNKSFGGGSPDPKIKGLQHENRVSERMSRSSALKLSGVVLEI